MAGKLLVQGSGGNFLDMIMRVAFLLLNNVFIIGRVARGKHPEVLDSCSFIEKNLNCELCCSIGIPDHHSYLGQ